MKLSNRAALMIVVLALAACAPAAEQVVVEEPDTTEADIEAINEVVDTYFETMELEDLDAHMALWAEDGVLHRNALPVVSGTAAIRASVVDLFEQLDWDFTRTDVEVDAAEDLGYHLSRYTLVHPATEDRDEITYYGSTMVILRRQSDGTWKISRYIWNNRGPDQE
jgi:uncharacterized protein (TIGR02246 family)